MAKSFYATNTALASGVHVALGEYALSQAADSGDTTTQSITKGTSQLPFLWTTAQYLPNDPDWPSAAYTCQIDCTAAGADLTYGVRAVGTANGHFARVNDALSADSQSWADSQAAFSGTGVKSATTGTVDPSAGLATDRYEVLLACNNAAAHTNEDLTLQFDSDATATGGWRDSWTGSASDSVSATDSVTAEKTASAILRSASDSVSVSDATPTRTGDLLRKPADTATVTDGSSRTATLERINSDTASVTDAAGRGLLVERNPSDSVTSTDATPARTADLGRTPSDTVATTDGATRYAGFERSSSDSESVADAAVRGLTAERAGTDSVSVTDSATKAPTLGRAGSDTVSASDNARRELEIQRTIGESVATSDALAKTMALWRAPTQDSIDSTDAVLRELTAPRQASDTVDTTDSASAVKQTAGASYERDVSDSVSVSDTGWGSTGLWIESASDTASATDQGTRTATLERRIDDWRGIQY